MNKLIAMLMIGWIPQSDGTLKEAWRLEERVKVEHCLTMTQFAGGGKYGAITVKCGDTTPN